MAVNPRYAPELRLLVERAPVPATLRGSVTRISVQTGLGMSDRVEMALANNNLRWLDHPLLAVDNELAVQLGYAPDPLTQLFSGEIVGHEAMFPQDGLPTMSIVAQDRKRRLQQGTKTRSFAIPIPKVGNMPLPDTAVASAVALENGLLPVLEPVGAAISALLGAAGLAGANSPAERQALVRRQGASGQGESDFDFVSKIAAENGWELVIDHAGPLGGLQLRYMSPLDHLAPALTLKYGASLLEFRPRISTVGQIVSVTAYVWISEIKTKLAITVGWDWDAMALTIDVKPSFTPSGKGSSNVVLGEPVTMLTAPRTILSELIPKLNRRLTGTGSCVGDPRIVAGAVIRMEGLGVQFGGLYRVVSATHALDSSGYRTSFEVRKEIWFGSIPLPEQGASPIRLNAPFVT
jgi:phage protein D